MRKIIFGDERIAIDINDVSEDTPIFAKQEGKLKGMVVNEHGEGWILRIGGEKGCSGHDNTRVKCLTCAAIYGYEFYIED